MPRWTVALALLVAATALAPSLATATTATDLCPLVADPCVVSADIAVDPNSVIDLGGRALDVKNRASLTIASGTMTILARSMHVEIGGALLGKSTTNGGVIVVNVVQDITIDGNTTTQGRIDVSAGVAAGEMDLTAGTTMTVSGLLTANATTPNGDGGTVNVNAGTDVSITGPIAVAGGAGGTGGSVTMVAGGALNITQPIDASGGDSGGGSIDLTAGGDLVTAGKLDVSGGGNSGDGGFLSWQAGGAVRILGPVNGKASGTIDTGGGDGADSSVTANGDVQLGGAMTLTGGSPDGEGGSLDVEAGGNVAQVGGVLVGDGGIDGCGGDVTMSANGTLQLGLIDVSGGSCGGGTMFASGGMLTRVPQEINADGVGDGDGGGEVDITGQALTITGNVHANASTGDPAGFVGLAGCNVDLQPAGVVSATGTGGKNQVQVSGQLTVSGTMAAGVGGTNEIDYRDPAMPPVLTGSITPAPVLALAPGLPPCAITGAVCGNGVLEAGEQCDDGNTTSCDGCSRSCRTEGCGNGVVECGEQCDDGSANGAPGGRCDANCKLVAATRLVPGSTRGTTGCFYEWSIVNPRVPLLNGFPSNSQLCYDGDPSCDFDGANDGQCTFRIAGCLGVQDTRLPACHPQSIATVNVHRPSPIAPKDAVEQSEAALVVGALEGLGVTVQSGTAVLKTGVPDATPNDCTAALAIRVPHPPGLAGHRLLSVGAVDAAGHRLRNNRLLLTCSPNFAYCGNGRVELGEECDDGNTNSCDGCSSTCRIETCGDGIVSCGEQCDDGPLNGTPGDRCTATCQESPPALRIRGGGAARSDCALEWSADLATPAVDRKGRPTIKQTCHDGDPTCDFGSVAGQCRFHVWACLAGDDVAAGCTASAVASVDVLKPKAGTPGAQGAARQALVDQLGRITFPVGPGEVCTGRVDVDVPAGRSKLTFRTKAVSALGVSDRDALTLGCTP